MRVARPAAASECEKEKRYMIDREPARSFEDLIVWQKAHDFVLGVYRATRSFPQEELYGLTSQLRRAATSVPGNIAEGFKRKTKADKARTGSRPVARRVRPGDCAATLARMMDVDMSHPVFYPLQSCRRKGLRACKIRPISFLLSPSSFLLSPSSFLLSPS